MLTVTVTNGRVMRSANPHRRQLAIACAGLALPFSRALPPVSGQGCFQRRMIRPTGVETSGRSSAAARRRTFARQPSEEQALARVRTAAVGQPARMCCGGARLQVGAATDSQSLLGLGFGLRQEKASSNMRLKGRHIT